MSTFTKTTPCEEHDTAIIFVLSRFNQRVGKSWIDQDIAVTREFYHALKVYYKLLQTQNHFYSCVIKKTASFQKRWRYSGDMVLGDTAMERVSQVISRIETICGSIELSLSPFSDPMTYERAIAILQKTFEPTLKRTKTSMTQFWSFHKNLPGLMGERVCRFDAWENEGLKLFGADGLKNLWWTSVFLPNAGVWASPGKVLRKNKGKANKLQMGEGKGPYSAP